MGVVEEAMAADVFLGEGQNDHHGQRGDTGFLPGVGAQ